ncbi:MAG TPA: hypothetical protein VF094_07915 [Gaiellaceae bacterium]
MNPITKAMLGVAALGAVLFALSGIFADAHGFEGVLGGIGWFGFLLCALTLIVLALVALGRGVLRRASTA